MTSLTEGTLTQLNAEVSLPRYDRRRVTTGIVHIGVGNFHRSHQAMYIDTLMNNGAAMDWGICGIGLQPSNVRMRDVLAAQDGLYTLVIRHSDGTWDARVIGSIVEYLFAPDDPEAAIEKMAAPATRIVSLTVTEGGYNLDAVTGEFNASDASVVADLRPGAAPRTVFGLVTEALARRRDRGIPAFTVVSCDNIQGNGHLSQRAFTAFARLRDRELADWMTRHVRFPNCMVDRITPQTTEGDRAELSRRFGIDDQWPVLCEPFTQWVLEDNFADGRPPLEDVGVQIVSDVEPYELMKLRLLNASHQALCYPGYLVGYRLVHDVTTDPLFAGFLLDYMTQKRSRPCGPCPAWIWSSTRTSSSSDSPIPRSATPWPGCAPTHRTSFPSSCCPSSGTSWPPVVPLPAPRPSWPAGPATPRAPTRTASHTSSTTPWRRSCTPPPDGNAATRPPSSRTTARSSVNWPTTPGSPWCTSRS